MFVTISIVAKYEPRDYVKAEFRDDKIGESEWMWVHVEYADESNRLVFGWLDSDPVLDSADVHLGKRLAVGLRQHP